MYMFSTFCCLRIHYSAGQQPNVDCNLRNMHGGCRADLHARMHHINIGILASGAFKVSASMRTDAVGLTMTTRRFGRAQVQLGQMKSLECRTPISPTQLAGVCRIIEGDSIEGDSTGMYVHACSSQCIEKIRSPRETKVIPGPSQIHRLFPQVMRLSDKCASFSLLALRCRHLADRKLKFWRYYVSTAPEFM